MRRGRDLAEFGVVSGALALMTNIVMAYNAGQLQKSVDAEVAGGVDLAGCIEALQHVGPVAYETARRQSISCLRRGHVRERRCRLLQTPQSIEDWRYRPSEARWSEEIDVRKSTQPLHSGDGGPQ
jgi:hypothetical protein